MIAGRFEKVVNIHCTKKMKFSIKEFFSKCNQICCFCRIRSHLLKKPLMENFIFSAVIIDYQYNKGIINSCKTYLQTVEVFSKMIYLFWKQGFAFRGHCEILNEEECNIGTFFKILKKIKSYLKGTYWRAVKKRFFIFKYKKSKQAHRSYK